MAGIRIKTMTMVGVKSLQQTILENQEYISKMDSARRKAFRDVYEETIHEYKRGKELFMEYFIHVKDTNVYKMIVHTLDKLRKEVIVTMQKNGADVNIDYFVEVYDGERPELSG